MVCLFRRPSVQVARGCIRFSKQGLFLKENGHGKSVVAGEIVEPLSARTLTGSESRRWGTLTGSESRRWSSCSRAELQQTSAVSSRCSDSESGLSLARGGGIRESCNGVSCRHSAAASTTP